MRKSQQPTDDKSRHSLGFLSRSLSATPNRAPQQQPIPSHSRQRPRPLAAPLSRERRGTIARSTPGSSPNAGKGTRSELSLFPPFLAEQPGANQVTACALRLTALWYRALRCSAAGSGEPPATGAWPC